MRDYRPSSVVLRDVSRSASLGESQKRAINYLGKLCSGGVVAWAERVIFVAGDYGPCEGRLYVAVEDIIGRNVGEVRATAGGYIPALRQHYYLTQLPPGDAI